MGYWNLLKKKIHKCITCSNANKNKGRAPVNKGVRQEPKHIGNVYHHSDGYPMVWVGKTNHASGYMPVHRLVASAELNQLVTKQQKVHHINGVKTDYRPENLYVCRDMSHHRQVHHQLETLSMLLVKHGLIEFNKSSGKYELSRPIEELIGEKSGELLETPNMKDEGNQQLSSEELAEKVQRLFERSTLK